LHCVLPNNTQADYLIVQPVAEGKRTVATNSTLLKKGGPWARLAALAVSLPWIASVWATDPPIELLDSLGGR